MIVNYNIYKADYLFDGESWYQNDADIFTGKSLDVEQSYADEYDDNAIIREMKKYGFLHQSREYKLSRNDEVIEVQDVEKDYMPVYVLKDSKEDSKEDSEVDAE